MRFATTDSPSRRIHESHPSRVAARNSQKWVSLFILKKYTQFLIVPTQAINHWQRVVELQPDNGDVWSAMGHCFLMQDDLQKAYMAYQQALYFLPNPKVRPKSIRPCKCAC